MIDKISPLTWYLMGFASGTTLQFILVGVTVWLRRRSRVNGDN